MSGLASEQVDWSAPALARGSCEQVFSRFLVNIDRSRASAGLELFTPDAVLDVAGVVSDGSEEIEATLAAREALSTRATLHFFSTFDFEQTAAAEACARGGLVIYAGAPGDLDRTPETLAHYAVEFRRLGERWAISRYEVRICGRESSL
jgi:hypothetical protein